MIQAVFDKVVVEVMKESQKTEGGILIPDNANQMPQIHGKVISVGETIETIKPGEVVVCHRNAGQDILLSGVIHKVLMYGEVYGVVRD
jgi:co-chaperonin GroES (HSP10)